MSRSVAVFKGNARQLDEMMLEQQNQTEIERKRQKVMVEITKAFESDIDTVIKSVSQTSEILDELSSELMGYVLEQEKGTESAALDATIEAQRTGEAAGEVNEQIGTVKRISQDAGASIERVAGVIEKINLYRAEISSAVTEQQSSTEEISRSIELLAQESELVKNVIAGVVEASKQTGVASNQLHEASQKLNANSSDLSTQVRQFPGNIHKWQ
jgi:methyl-accepting chemotaxis protein